MRPLPPFPERQPGPAPLFRTQAFVGDQYRGQDVGGSGLRATMETVEGVLHCEPGGDVSPGVATHAIGKNAEPAIGTGPETIGIFIDRTATRIGKHGNTQIHREPIRKPTANPPQTHPAGLCPIPSCRLRKEPVKEADTRRLMDHSQQLKSQLSK